MTTNSLARIYNLKHAASNINPQKWAYPDWLVIYVHIYMDVLLFYKCIFTETFKVCRYGICIS